MERSFIERVAEGIGREEDDGEAKWQSWAAGCELLSHSKKLLAVGHLTVALLLSVVDIWSGVVE